MNSTLNMPGMAQEMIDTIHPLLGERTIAFMETGGVIIASTDPSRIGVFHQGAAEAAANHRVVYVTQAEAAGYPSGAGEGIAMPVVRNGELLGVAAINGTPEDVEQAARLLGVCVNLYLEQAMSGWRRQVSEKMLQTFAWRILTGGFADDERGERARELDLELRLPVRFMVILADSPNDGHKQRLEKLSRIHTVLYRENRIAPRHDFAAVLDDAVLACLHIPSDADAAAVAREIHALLGRELHTPISVGMGGSCDAWEDAVESCREARSLAEMSQGECHCIDSASAKVDCLLRECMRADSPSYRYMGAFEAALRRGFGPGHMPRVMRTIRAYCNADCSGGKAAADLGIHKNTMNYRMNKIIALLGLENENAFVREFFLRLLLLRHEGSR